MGRMNEILNNLESGDLEAAVNCYESLSSDEKRDILERIRSIRTRQSALFLSRALEKTSEREIRKSIKKLLFILKTLGISVEAPKATEEPVLRKIEDVREQKAFLSSYDPEGTRMVLLAFEMKKRQFVFLQAISHFIKGLVDLAAVPVPRDEMNDILKDYQARMERPIVLAPIAPKYARYLTEEASAVSGTHSDELRKLKPLMSGLKGEVDKPADIYGLPVPEETRSRSLRAILSDSMFEPFTITWDGIDDDKKELDAVINPSIVLPPYVIEERRQAFIDGLVQADRLLSARRRLKRMLEDYSYLFHSIGEPEAFKGLTEGLPDEQFIKEALLFFVKKALEKKEKEEDQPSVLVDPFKQEPPQRPYPRR
jgi:hypothetical protein